MEKIEAWMKSVEARLANHDQRLHRRVEIPPYDRADVEPLGRWYAALGYRYTRPAVVVTLGSSTTWGASATQRENEWTSIMLRLLQTAYPGVPGSEAAPKKFSESITTVKLPGVQLFNGAVSGTTSANYFSATSMLGINGVSPALVIHMIGSNDSVPGGLYVDPDTYKTNVENAITTIDAARNAANRPVSHVLAHTFRRWQVTPADWAVYGQKLREIAEARPNVYFVDVSTQFEIMDLYGGNPFNVMSPDTVHMTDDGHRMMADTLFREIRGDSLPSRSTVVLQDDYRLTAGTPAVTTSGGARPYSYSPSATVFEHGGGGTLVHSAGGTIWADAGETDIDVSGVINTGTGASLAGLVFRLSDNNNRLGLFLNRGTQQVIWYKTEAGVTTVLQADAATLSASTNYYVRVIAQGGRLRGYLNGALVSDYTMTPADTTTFTAPGFTSVGWRCGAPTSGLHYRGLQARTLT